MNMPRRRSKDVEEIRSSSKPAVNQSKKTVMILGVIAITIGLVLWVWYMGKSLQKTVAVTMTAQPIYKNQQITESMLIRYDMSAYELENYSKNMNGSKVFRYVLWENRGNIIGTYAAYPIMQNEIVEYRKLVPEKVQNTDTLLYNFPGKEIVVFELGGEALGTFGKFLRPGDRLVINALYNETDTTNVIDPNDPEKTIELTNETFRVDQILNDIPIADMLNSNGDSVLDIMETYRDLGTYEQAQLDATFKELTRPSVLLAALSPEEKELYYYYLNTGCEFRVSLPQRVE